MTQSTTPDPREQLVRAGQALLDAHYELHTHWYEIGMDPLADYTEDEKNAKFKAAEDKLGMLGILGFVAGTSMLKDNLAEKERDYIRLRTTIEALDAPRPPMPGDPAEAPSRRNIRNDGDSPLSWSND